MAQPGLLQPSADQMEQTLKERQKQKFLTEMKAVSMEKMSPNTVADAFKYIKEFDVRWNDERKGYNPWMEKPLQGSFKADFLTSDLTSSVIERGSLSSSQMGSISADKILDAIGQLAQITSTNSASTTLSNGEQAVLTFTLDDTSDDTRIMLGVAHITPFHTTVAGANIIPYGASETPGSWLWANRADWNSNNNVRSSWVDYVRNVAAGASQSVVWRLHYRYLGKRAAES